MHILYKDNEDRIVALCCEVHGKLGSSRSP